MSSTRAYGGIGLVSGAIALVLGLLAAIPLAFGGGIYTGLGLGFVGVFLLGRLLRRLSVSALGVAGWAVAGLLFWRPLFKGVVYGLVFENPSTLFTFVVLTGLLVANIVLRYRSPEKAAVTNAHASAMVVIVVLSLAAAGLGGIYASEHVGSETWASAQQIEDLPESPANNSRIVPEVVATNWATNTLQYSKYKVSSSDITYIDGTPYWSYSLVPNGIRNRLTEKQIGAVFVNQSSFDRDSGSIVTRDNLTFEYGNGMALTDNVDWQLAMDDYFSDYRDNFVVTHDGEGYLVVPYVEHTHQFRALPIPMVYSTPEFGGVKIVSQNGTITDLSPAEARKSPLLAEQNYYPYSLAKFKISATKYRNGILNTLPVIGSHDDEIEVAPVPGGGNDQPFTVPARDGAPRYFVAAEPFGKANGIKEIWSINSQTGEYAVKRYSRASALRGPRKSIDSIMGEPDISRLNDVSAVEPIPVIRNGTLYWQVRIIPDSNSRIVFIGFFNAETERTTIVESTRGVQAFLAGQDVTRNDTDGDDRGETPTDGATETLELVIEYPDGETRTITVPEGTTIRIDRPAANATNESDG